MELLSAQVTALKESMKGAAPEEILAAFSDEQKGLVKSGIAENVIKAGQTAPDFTLPNALLKEVQLSDAWQKGPVVLTFYRGSWCPYCNLQLKNYQRIIKKIEEMGASLIAVSPQTPDNALTIVEKQGLEFETLSDKGNAVARKYGLVYSLAPQIKQFSLQIGTDLSSYNGDESWELPLPGTFIIDQTGIIKLAHVSGDYTVRLEPEEILRTLSSL